MSHWYDQIALQNCGFIVSYTSIPCIPGIPSWVILFFLFFQGVLVDVDVPCDTDYHRFFLFFFRQQLSRKSTSSRLLYPQMRRGVDLSLTSTNKLSLQCTTLQNVTLQKTIG